jgi:hypothetical protein
MDFARAAAEARVTATEVACLAASCSYAEARTLNASRRARDVAVNVARLAVVVARIHLYRHACNGGALSHSAFVAVRKDAYAVAIADGLPEHARSKDICIIIRWYLMGN